MKNKELKRRLEYLEKMVEHNFQDNGRIQRQVGDLRFDKIACGNVTTVDWAGRNSRPKVKVKCFNGVSDPVVLDKLNELLEIINCVDERSSMQDDRQFELSERLNRAEQRLADIEESLFWIKRRVYKPEDWVSIPPPCNLNYKGPAKKKTQTAKEQTNEC